MTTPEASALELLSALTDGELADFEIADVQLQLGRPGMQSNAWHANWDSYHVIGHALRGNLAASSLTGADPAFLQRLNHRLANEQIGLLVTAAPTPVKVALPMQPAANQAVFRWKMLAGFASVSAALVVAWSFVAAPGASTSLQLSQSQALEQVLVASPQGLVVRDARLEELLAAHQRFGGSSLQAPSGFLRNAGFETVQSSGR